MKKMKRMMHGVLSVLIIISMVSGLVLEIPLPPVFAAGNVPIKNFVERDTSGRLVLRLDWSAITLSTRAKSAKVSWVDLDATNVPELNVEDYNEPIVDTSGITTGYRDITKVILPLDTGLFSNGILYQLKIDFYTDGNYSNPITGTIGESTFLLGVVLNAEAVTSSEVRTVSAAGEKESGFKPSIRILWEMPRVYVHPSDPYNEIGGDFLRIFDEPGTGVLRGPAYDAALAAIQKVDATIGEFTLVIGIKNYLYSQNLELACQNIELIDSSGLKACVEFDSGRKYLSEIEKVDSADPDDDRYQIYLLGRQDISLGFPQGADWDIISNPDVEAKFVPDEITNSFDTILRHEEIYPGSIYHIHAEIKMRNMNGTEIVETPGFNIVANKLVVNTSTALRIKVSRVSDEFVKVDVYRINQGKDFVSGYAYKVELRMDTQTSLDPVMQVSVSDIDDQRETVQGYVRVTSPTMTYYYTSTYVDANMLKLLTSFNVPYKLYESGSNAPTTPKGVVIEKLEYIPETKSTNVTISWDKPGNWEGMNLADTYIEFELNTSYLSSDTKYETLYDEEGTAFGRFYQQYKTVLAVSGLDVQKTVTNDRLVYTIEGAPDSLFQVIATPPQAPTGTETDPDLAYPATYWTDQQTKTAVNQTDLYPDYLLPNTRYFIMLRTVNRATDSNNSVIGRTESNPSISVGFTTYPTDYTVPLPFVFRVTDNSITPTPSGTATFENSVSLQNTAVDWKYVKLYVPQKEIFYELYISDNPLDPKPQLAGITNNISRETWNDPVWGQKMRLPAVPAGQLAAELITGTSQLTSQGTIIDWNGIKKFDGKPLQPNKIYYFWIRSYIIEKDRAGNEYINGDEMHSVMLAVTTRPYPQEPDETFRRLLAPVALAIAKDKDGNEIVTGETAMIEWMPTGEDVLFELIITTSRDIDLFLDPGNGLPFGDPALAPAGLDLLYESFIREFDNDDGTVDKRLLLDPAKQNELFYFDPIVGKYFFLFDRWLFPNSLYFISIRAVKRDTGGAARDEDFYKTLNNTSAFVTIPLTTLLLDAPFDLKTVIDAQLGFQFKDSTPGYLSEDYHIYLRLPGQTDYMLAGGTQGTILRSGDFVYGRIRNLEFKKSYDIRVTRGAQTPVIVFESIGVRTRDASNSVEVEWKGIAMQPNDAFLHYQVAIISQRELDDLPSDEVEYFELSDINLQFFRYAKDDVEYPYYIAENNETVIDLDIMNYHAVILSKPTRLKNGKVEQRPLESNMRYYIKVRTRKVRREDPDVSAFSKFVGPVDARTNFVQKAQDEQEEQLRLEENFLNELEEFEQENLYEIDLGLVGENKLLMKEDKVVGILKSSPDISFLIDISENLKKAQTDVVYIPGGILRALQSFDKSLTIRTMGAEYILSKNTIDLQYSDSVADMTRKAGTDVLMVRLKSERNPFLLSYAPQGSKAITGFYTLTADIIASRRSYENIRTIINDYIYNDKTGLVTQKISALSYNTEFLADSNEEDEDEDERDPFDEEERDIKQQKAEETRKRKSNDYVTELIRDLRSAVSYKIGDVVEGRNGYQSIISDIINMKEFNAPIGVRLNHDRQKNGKVSPFVSFDQKEWFKMTQNITNAKTSIAFEAISPGTYSAVIAGIDVDDLREGSDSKSNVEKVSTKYELSDIFAGIDTNLRPELPVLNKEAVLAYERILDLSRQTYGLDMAKKIVALKLDDIVKPGTQNAQMSRQQAAELLVRMYLSMNGVANGTLSGSRTYTITDADEIQQSYKKAVNLCLEKGFLKLTGGKFNPSVSIKRIEFLDAVAVMIQ